MAGLRWALWTAVVQGGVLLGVSGYLGIRVAAGQASSAAVAAFAVLLTALGGVVVAGGAVLVLRGRTWPRTSLTLLEFLAALEGINLVRGGEVAFAVVVSLPAAAVTAVLVRQRAVAARTVEGRGSAPTDETPEGSRSP